MFYESKDLTVLQAMEFHKKFKITCEGKCKTVPTRPGRRQVICGCLSAWGYNQCQAIEEALTSIKVDGPQNLTMER